jgi:hypothetical protein
MRLVGYLLVGCIACAVLQAAATALVLTIALAAVCGLLARPRETIWVLTLLLVAGLIDRHPFVLLAVAAALALMALPAAKDN